MREYRIAKRLVRFCLLLVALLLSSCGRRVRVASPLSDPDKAKPDEQLCGMWKVVPSDKEPDDSSNAFLCIGKVGRRDVPSGIMMTIMIYMDAEKKIMAMPMYFFTTSIGDNKYANLFEEAAFDQARTPTWNKRNIKDFILYKYKVEGDKLIVWWDKIDDDAVIAAVRKGELKGTIEGKGNPNETVTLTDGGDLSRFLSKGGDKKFFHEENKDVFLRVK